MISYSRIREFAERMPAAAEALDRWYEIAQHATWMKLADVRKDFSHCDPVVVGSGNVVHVFNIGGNKFRLIAAIHFDFSRVFILRILTHAEYDKIDAETV